MTKLFEIKNQYYHYYKDEDGRFQGEYKEWHGYSIKRERQVLYKDDKLHGEYKYWGRTGKLEYQDFYQNNEDITYQVKALVVDILNITDEERMMIKLKFGIDCISEEINDQAN